MAQVTRQARGGGEILTRRVTPGGHCPPAGLLVCSPQLTRRCPPGIPHPGVTGAGSRPESGVRELPQQGAPPAPFPGDRRELGPGASDGWLLRVHPLSAADADLGLGDESPVQPGSPQLTLGLVLSSQGVFPERAIGLHHRAADAEENRPCHGREVRARLGSWPSEGFWRQVPLGSRLSPSGRPMPQWDRSRGNTGDC